MKDYFNKVKESAGFLRNCFGPAPKVAMVFGTGLGWRQSQFPVLAEAGFSDIPNFPDLELAGHERVIRVLEGPEEVCFVHGRYHFYEGLSAHEVVFPVRALSEWGVENFFLTNSAAALKEEFGIGELLLIRDHIGFFTESPLPWPGRSGEDDNFTDMSEAYDPQLRAFALEQAGLMGINLREGVYLSVPGPAFETPEEIKFLQKMNADAVGMSMVPEVIALRNQGKRVLGMSCLTNYGAGMKPGIIDHSGVIETAERSSEGMMRLLLAVAGKAAHSPP
jgi:purine-nucleoside phosphorylase